MAGADIRGPLPPPLAECNTKIYIDSRADCEPGTRVSSLGRQQVVEPFRSVTGKNHDTRRHSRSDGLYGTRADQDSSPPWGSQNHRPHKPPGGAAAYFGNS